MKEDNLNELFQSLDFDIAEPPANHQQRFESKLEGKSRRNIKTSGVIPLWLPWIGMAASFLIAFLLFQGIYGTSNINQGELASVSSEMEETQNFYASIIKKELYNLDQQKTPQTEAVITDALQQLEVLEKDYVKLKQDLITSGQDKRVIYAMISNFQKRIDLLNEVLEKASTINTLKQNPYENSIL